MAQVNIGEEQNPVIPTAPIQEPSAEINIPTPEPQPTDEKLLPPSDKIVGLSSEEINDPNKINIEISDHNAPIVVLFGQPACGKTMTLVRLTRYLISHGYSVDPVHEFRPNYDANYTKICEDFNVMMNEDDAAKTTSKISFINIYRIILDIIIFRTYPFIN